MVAKAATLADSELVLVAVVVAVSLTAIQTTQVVVLVDLVVHLVQAEVVPVLDKGDQVGQIKFLILHLHPIFQAVEVVAQAKAIITLEQEEHLFLFMLEQEVLEQQILQEPLEAFMAAVAEVLEAV
jgi:hypothetical protein